MPRNARHDDSNANRSPVPSDSDHELNEAESASLDEAIGPLASDASIHDDDGPAPPEPRRAEVVDRRLGLDRRNMPGAAAPTGLERRRGRGRRLSDFHRSAEEGEMTQEQFMFLMAIDAFKKGNDVTFPAWSDVLEIVRLLGYRKVQKSAVDLGRADDWTEPSGAPHNVRTDKQLQRNAAARAAFKRQGDAA
ncbi:MAG: hypothetical protein AAFV77_10085 [Planctomycetota bacterium]